jgi:carbohydrate-selective porin OprB
MAAMEVARLLKSFLTVRAAAQCQTSPYTFKNTSYLIFPTLTWFSNTTYNTTNQSFTSLQSITKGDRHILLTA